MKRVMIMIAAALLLAVPAVTAQTKSTTQNAKAGTQATQTSTARATPLDITAQMQHKGTITSYIEANAATNQGTKACYDHAMASSQFTCLAAALKETGLDKTLAEKGPYTLFAPTDEAFKTWATGMKAGEFDTLFKDKAKLTNILNYHVVAEKKTLNDFLASAKNDEASLTTLEKGTSTLSFADVSKDKKNAVVSFKGSEAHVMSGQTVADNGVIIPIDHVLTPSTNM